MVCWFVEHSEIRLDVERMGEGYSLTLTAGKLSHLCLKSIDTKFPANDLRVCLDLPGTGSIDFGAKLRNATRYSWVVMIMNYLVTGCFVIVNKGKGIANT